ncbi:MULTISPECIES: signal peptidase II [Helicobacter]|uniref:Lipoprotein signal peptidase n=4 Tax=Helicobacter typhlonius TaxID=76936 RepID=A0A099UBT8_9HELI|nr:MULTISPECIES: signal peptidase II [Helicobacter]TLD78645.1 lipoprotein signal peptidase [Helicobacter typhlonius]TLD89397.1 lipoprotein signal peptidase [Helicobacter sp. MIT 03-1616]CUU40093.1 Lipoprotein signal peptidase [Helicobacter typhlonius]HCD73662.1 lipoprotein signal peptidase [Helicobacter sp.]
MKYSSLKYIDKKQIAVFVALFVLSIVLDQWVKLIMLGGFEWESEALTIGGRALVYNKGVAFSMFSFLEEYLKYIQIVFLCAVLIFALMSDFFIKYYAALGILLGSGLSNVFDRFIHGGVVDYVYWHYWFDFAIFNLADVLIDCSVVIIILQMLKGEKSN